MSELLSAQRRVFDGPHPLAQSPAHSLTDSDERCCCGRLRSDVHAREPCTRQSPPELGSASADRSPSRGANPVGGHPDRTSAGVPLGGWPRRHAEEAHRTVILTLNPMRGIWPRAARLALFPMVGARGGIQERPDAGASGRCPRVLPRSGAEARGPPSLARHAQAARPPRAVSKKSWPLGAAEVNLPRDLHCGRRAKSNFPCQNLRPRAPSEMFGRFESTAPRGVAQRETDHPGIRCTFIEGR